MEKKPVFSKIVNWLSNTEMFARPSRQLPGIWLLYEYFMDSEEKLLNFKEDTLRGNGEYLQLDVDRGSNFVLTTNLPVSLFESLKIGEWNVSKNYVTLIHPNDFRKSVEFQYAIEKGRLKLLKKDALGKIEFFGFFKKLKVS